MSGFDDLNKPSAKRHPAHRWHGNNDRSDLVMMGEPDCHVYVVRFVGFHRAMYGNAYCWTLTMPRGSSNVYYGWDRSMPLARRGAEAAIKENW